jgi:hypothetical protein
VRGSNALAHAHTCMHACMQRSAVTARHACRTPELACVADEDEAVSGGGAALGTVPERIAYLALMRAYASDAWSAQQTCLQLQDNRGYEGYKQLTWHAGFRRLLLVHAHARHFPDDAAADIPVGSQDDADDLEEAVAVGAAFLALMRAVLERSRPAGEAQLRVVRDCLSVAYADCRATLSGTLADTPSSPEELLIAVRHL